LLGGGGKINQGKMEENCSRWLAQELVVWLVTCDLFLFECYRRARDIPKWQELDWCT